MIINSFTGRYNFLSNFYQCEIKHQGLKYPSVEHFYVSMKMDKQQMIRGVLYTPSTWREMIISIKEPGKIKKIGRLIQLRSNWETFKFDVMNWAIREKFKDEKLKDMLLSTGDNQIVEGNYWHDNVWGQCECPKCYGKGENKLGIILMDVRKELLLQGIQSEIKLNN